MAPAHRPIVLLLLLLASWTPLLAQRSAFGVKGGVQVSTYRATNLRVTQVPGAVFGIFRPIAAAPRLEVQPELLLSVQGAGFLEPDGKNFRHQTLYLLAPVSAKYFLNRRLNLQGGIYFGTMLLAQRIDDAPPVSVLEAYRSFDMGFQLGLGFDMRKGVDLSLRYGSGMSTLLREDQVFYPRNRTLHFTLGKRLIQMRKAPVSRRRKR
jgi:hypothetical protein